MKKVVCISSFCDSEIKKNVLRETINRIKSLGLDVMVISPNFIQLDFDIISSTDFIFFTKENPLIGFPERQYTHWVELPLVDGRVLTLHRGFREYGWASLYQIKKVSQIALTYDYDIFHHVLYDLEITKEVEQELLSDKVNLNRARINPLNPSEVLDNGMLFMTFDRDMMNKIEKELNYEDYLNGDGFAESHWYKWRDKFNLGTSSVIVKDRIYHWGDQDFFDFSPFKDFKMFVSKHPQMDIWLGYDQPYSKTLDSKLRIVFFNFEKEFEIKLIINSKEFVFTPKNREIIELPVDSQEISQFLIIYGNESHDFLKKFLDIPFNQIYYNYKN